MTAARVPPKRLTPSQGDGSAGRTRKHIPGPLLYFFAQIVSVALQLQERYRDEQTSHEADLVSELRRSQGAGRLF